MIKWGVGDASVVYAMYDASYDFLRYVRSQNRKVVLDIFMNPLTDRIESQEARSYPSWGCRILDPGALARKETYLLRNMELADVLLCPSNWVSDGVKELAPVLRDKIRIVPYGNTLPYGNEANVPTKGRILFVGSRPLLKGMHFFARAAESLRRGRPTTYQFIVAGKIDADIMRQPECSCLHFLASVSSDRIKQEFLTADVLVLPTLSDGFSGVVMEAMAAGLPVITTRSSGVDFLDRREGLYVPVGDVSSLASAIDCVVGDRGFRATLARGGLCKAKEFTREAWQHRLVSVLLDLHR